MTAPAANAQGLATAPATGWPGAQAQPQGWPNTQQNWPDAAGMSQAG
jgi:hypothetical protein